MNECEVVKACAVDFMQKVSVNPKHKLAHSLEAFNLPSSKYPHVRYYVAKQNAGDAVDALRALPQAIFAPVVDDAAAGWDVGRRLSTQASTSMQATLLACMSFASGISRGICIELGFLMQLYKMGRENYF